jgi:hypothetical protein
MLLIKKQNEDKGTIMNGQSRDIDTIWVHQTQNEHKGTIKRTGLDCDYDKQNIS